MTATGRGGESARSAEVSTTPAPNLPLTVNALPADGPTQVARNTALTLSFNKAVTATTVTTGTACTRATFRICANRAKTLAVREARSTPWKRVTPSKSASRINGSC